MPSCFSDSFADYTRERLAARSGHNMHMLVAEKLRCQTDSAHTVERDPDSARGGLYSAAKTRWKGAF